MQRETPGEEAVSPVRVAVVQCDPRVGVENREANAAAVEKHLVAAATAGAGLVVLPELATTGYVFTSRAEAFAHAEPVPDGPSVALFARVASEHDVYVVGCLVERDGDRLFDTAVLVGPRGYVGRYRKTHLYDNEKLWFTPGDEGFAVFETPIGRIGLLICWDIWFPETTRIVSQLGADIICIPTGWVTGGTGGDELPDGAGIPSSMYDAQGVCMAAHLTYTAAHVNNVAIATAARTGVERGVGFLGNSLIAGTDGWPIGRIAGPEEDTILYADLDLTDARSAPVWSQLNDLHRDRRTDLYDGLLGYHGRAMPR